MCVLLLGSSALPRDSCYEQQSDQGGKAQPSSHLCRIVEDVAAQQDGGCTLRHCADALRRGRRTRAALSTCQCNRKAMSLGLQRACSTSRKRLLPLLMLYSLHALIVLKAMHCSSLSCRTQHACSLLAVQTPVWEGSPRRRCNTILSKLCLGAHAANDLPRQGPCLSQACQPLLECTWSKAASAPAQHSSNGVARQEG